MYYCKPGDILVIDAFYADTSPEAFSQLGLEPCLGVYLADNSAKRIRIPDGDFVMALESSVPPWYNGDTIRCLWNTKEVHVKRIALAYYERDENDTIENL